MTPHNEDIRPVTSPHPAEAQQPYAVSVSPLFMRLTPEQRAYVYQAMVRHGRNAVQLLNAVGEIMYTSEPTRIMLGYKPLELYGQDWRSYIHADDLPAFIKVWRKVLDKPDRAYTEQYRVRNRHGRWIWLEMLAVNRLQTPGVEAVVSNIRNITQRKEVEERLLENQKRWRFMAESLPELIFAMRNESDVEYMNPQWQEYSGLSLKRLFGQPALRIELVHPDDREVFWKMWQRSFRYGLPFEQQARLRRKDGVYRWHICRILPMQGEDGGIVLWMGSCTDIDDLQRAMRAQHELELQAATLEVQRKELLALNQSKDEFISLASHQLRTPATGVKQYLGMLLQGFAGPLNDDQRAFLQTAYESNERQIAIVNDLLQVARIDAGKIKLRLRKTNIIRLVKNVANEHSSEIAAREQRLLLRVPDKPLAVRLDADKLCMVLDNIIDNASKYTSSGRTITVAVAADAGKRLVTVAVTDQGIGMSSADADKIFNKFSRLENPLTKGVDGSGLGLYWAKKIVELHGGNIRVRSRLGRGTTFIVSLPV